MGCHFVMKKTNRIQKLLQTQFPTVLGVIVLVAALGLGVFLFAGDGLGSFAPRANPESIPRKVTISNVTNSSFTVSFVTDAPTSGYVSYGTDPNRLNTQIQDDRAQLGNDSTAATTHHITIRGLTAASSYYFVIGAGGGEYDDGGTPFEVTTASVPTPATAASSISGSVSNNGTPVTGAIVYVVSSTMEPLSALTTQSGQWAINLNQARDAQLSPLSLTDNDQVTIAVQGLQANQVMETVSLISQAKPLSEMDFSNPPSVVQGNIDIDTDTTTTTSNSGTTRNTADSTANTQNNVANNTLQNNFGDNAGSTQSGFDDIDQQTATEINLDELANGLVVPEVNTGQPKFTGTLPPLTEVDVQINSQTQINQQIITDASGNFELDLADLGSELEPGDHTIRLAYADPNSGNLVNQTYSFTVAQANTTSTTGPFGTPNPAPLGNGTGTTTGGFNTPATSSGLATSGARVSNPATTSAIPVSGTFEVTLALLAGGLFSIAGGMWSFRLAQLNQTPQNE